MSDHEVTVYLSVKVKTYGDPEKVERETVETAQRVLALNMTDVTVDVEAMTVDGEWQTWQDVARPDSQAAEVPFAAREPLPIVSGVRLNDLPDESAAVSARAVIYNKPLNGRPVLPATASAMPPEDHHYLG